MAVILGVDPGFGITGYGVIEADAKRWTVPRVIEAGILTSDKKAELQDRLKEIHDQFVSVLKEFSPRAVALEQIFSVGAFPKSAILIGHVHGIVLLAAAQAGIPVSTYYPIQVKRALLGYGHGSKGQMQRMVQRALNLDRPPQPDDVADALAVALCHANRSRA
jgi:crossover junction endodeoxyribonuclease RuvC